MKNAIKVPARLEELLSRNRSLHGAVNLTLAEFEPWLADNKVVFFPEYTDHGPDHIYSVITAAESLIHDDAWKTLTSEDAAVLILAILVHDCAMHLSEDGFVNLLSAYTAGQTTPSFNDPPWKLLWDEFLQEASRFDGRTLVKLFGEPDPIRRPPSNPLNWTLRDRLLMGEFLRRHHARLAHEITEWGVPGPSSEDRLSLVHVPKKLAMLAGFVARSHGLSLRYCVD